MAIEAAAVGVKAPLVTSPIAFPLVSATFMCVRAAARPSSLRPTRMRAGPSESSRRMRSAPGKSAFRAPALADGKGKPRFDRRGGFVHVLAVKRKARLKPQRIARAKADRAGLPARPAGGGRKLSAKRAGNGDFEAVFAGVARARNDRSVASPLMLETRRSLSMKLRASTPGISARKNRGGFRPLQGEQRPFRLRLELDVCRQRARAIWAKSISWREAFTISERPVPSGGARDHQVVDDAAFGVHKLRIADAARLEAQDIGRRQRLKGRRGRFEIRARKLRLAHMRNVEKPGGGAHMIVLFDDACRILQRHLVARERHEFAPSSRCSALRGVSRSCRARRMFVD